MTSPDDGKIEDDKDEAAGNAGALAAASQDGSDTDPLGPLNRVTEDDS
ncbi:MAG: hypothetical protein JWM62_2612 [Frankiales bacterium]|jgi:hypothetical protein|nr:hypothetical protein [Frankiales bacterium]